MVAIARAVDMECKVLILDEPTSSLDEQEVEKLFKLMLDLKSRGVGIIFVTHFLEQVYAVCDRITVLRDGKLVGEYKIADLPRVQLVSKMLGKELDDLSEIKSEGAADALEDAEVVYEAAGLSSAAGVRPFDFSIRKGEVNGFTGSARLRPQRVRPRDLRRGSCLRRHGEDGRQAGEDHLAAARHEARHQLSAGGPQARRHHR